MRRSGAHDGTHGILCLCWAVQTNESKDQDKKHQNMCFPETERHSGSLLGRVCLEI